MSALRPGEGAFLFFPRWIVCPRANPNLALTVAPQIVAVDPTEATSPGHAAPAAPAGAGLSDSTRARRNVAHRSVVNTGTASDAQRVSRLHPHNAGGSGTRCFRA